MAGGTLSPDRLANEWRPASSKPLPCQIHRRMWHTDDRNVVAHDDVEDHVLAFRETSILVGDIVTLSSYGWIFREPLETVSDLSEISFGLVGSPSVQGVVGNCI